MKSRKVRNLFSLCLLLNEVRVERVFAGAGGEQTCEMYTLTYQCLQSVGLTASCL